MGGGKNGSRGRDFNGYISGRQPQLLHKWSEQLNLHERRLT